MYPDLSDVIGEIVEYGSEYPYGPYIGLPSYAHPIIGECFLPLSSKIEEESAVEYPTHEYSNPLLVLINSLSPNLAALLTVRYLTSTSKIAPDPRELTSI